MATGNLYVCIKPFAAGEIMTTPADDPEHWALYLPRPEKGADGENGTKWYSANFRAGSSITEPISGLSPKVSADDLHIGDLVLNANTGQYWRIELIDDTEQIYAAAYVGSLQGAAGKRGATWISSSHMFPGDGNTTEIPLNSMSESPQMGDYIFSTHSESNGLWGRVESISSTTCRIRVAGSIRGPQGAPASHPTGTISSDYSMQYGASGVKSSIPSIGTDDNIFSVEFTSTGGLVFGNGYNPNASTFYYIRLIKAAQGNTFVWKGYGIKNNGTIEFLQPSIGENLYQINSGYEFNQFMYYRID